MICHVRAPARYNYYHRYKFRGNKLRSDSFYRPRRVSCVQFQIVWVLRTRLAIASTGERALKLSSKSRGRSTNTVWRRAASESVSVGTRELTFESVRNYLCCRLLVSIDACTKLRMYSNTTKYQWLWNEHAWKIKWTNWKKKWNF